MPRMFRFSIAVLLLALTFGAAGWVYGQAAQPQFPSQQPDPAARIIFFFGMLKNSCEAAYKEVVVGNVRLHFLNSHESDTRMKEAYFVVK